MYNECMFLDKFRNRYSFNFFAFSGICCLLFCLFNIYGFLNSGHVAELGFPFVLITFGIALLLCIVCLITLFIFIVEQIIDKRISNEKILKSKVVLCIQNFGFIFVIIQIFAVAFAVLYILF